MEPSSSSTSTICTSSGLLTSPRTRYSSKSFTACLADALRVQELADGLARLGAAREPVTNALFVEHDRRGIGLGVVMHDGLDHPSVTLGALVSDDSPPDGVLASADSR